MDDMGLEQCTSLYNNMSGGGGGGGGRNVCAPYTVSIGLASFFFTSSLSLLPPPIPLRRWMGGRWGGGSDDPLLAFEAACYSFLKLHRG